jgi:serine/threonine protein kinase
MTESEAASAEFASASVVGTIDTVATRAGTSPSAAVAPTVPDHDLLRPIGQGAYGEVWLARNSVGLYHAVKVMRRDRFPDAEPYEREFQGMKRFMPVSRLHPGLVHVLQVGRNDDQGYFYYVMELADDEALGALVHPDQYEAKNLARLLRRQQRLSTEECVALGTRLAGALDFLHQRRLVHRDVKPSNILYVHGQPKLADIGLVAESRGASPDASTLGSFVGTPGYIPPEGPGRPGGDIYALGKVLYEAATGKTRHEYPDLPTDVLLGPDAFQPLNEVILKACESHPANRYSTAIALGEALRQLEGTAKSQNDL